jgi:hypothetical protein
MHKIKIDKIKIKDDDELEVTTNMIDNYKTNTNKKRITKKGLENYFNNLIQFMNSRFI